MTQHTYKDKKVSAVLFDFDGTLADSCSDLTASLNELFNTRQVNTVAESEVRNIISKGSNAMLRLRLNFTDDSDEHKALKQQLFTIYSDRNHENTVLFTGIENCLNTLEKRNIPWGIVTNKLSHLAEPIVKKLELHSRSGCLVCPDTAGHAKPHPAPLLHAAKLMDVSPEECIYVGDAKTDVVAAQRANMLSVVANYGFIPKDENTQTWGSTGIIETPHDLIDLIHSS